MKQQHFPLLLLLLVVVVASSNADTTLSRLQYLEAPFFSNSLECEDPIDESEDDVHQHPSCRDNIIKIAMTLDETYLRGWMAVIISIIHHSTCLENLHLHLIYSRTDCTTEAPDCLVGLNARIAASFPCLDFDMYPFDEEIVRGRISASVLQALDRLLNFARSYLASLLPDCLGWVVYLDSDVIVVDDIGKQWSTEFANEKTVIAVREYCSTNMLRCVTPSFWSNTKFSSTFRGRMSKGAIQHGSDGSGLGEVEGERAEEDEDPRAGIAAAVPAGICWGDNAGGGEVEPARGHCRGLHPGEASLLHWSGRGKPWVRRREASLLHGLDAGRPCPVDALWVPYDMLRKHFHAPLESWILHEMHARVAFTGRR